MYHLLKSSIEHTGAQYTIIDFEAGCWIATDDGISNWYNTVQEAFVTACTLGCTELDAATELTMSMFDTPQQFCEACTAASEYVDITYICPIPNLLQFKEDNPELFI